MTSIKTLVQDIQARLTSGQPFDAETVRLFGINLANKLSNRLSEEYKPALRASNLGTPCERKLWYSINRPDTAEPVGPAARLKFLFGDILEEVLLFLARAAGHEVTHEQKEVNVGGVKGHIDGVIDGELVDVKSTTSYGLKKFSEHKLREDDPFGYITQLDGYLNSDISEYLTDKDHGHFLAVDKALGHIVLDTYEKSTTDYNSLVSAKRDMLAKPTPPDREYRAIPDGKSGNMRLDISCSYCPFKHTCWPGLRTFISSRGPVFLTEVRRQPNMQEDTR